MIINDLDDYYIVFDTKNRNTELDTLVIFAPDASAWTEIGMNWTNTIHHPSKAESGLEEVDYETILSTIVNSI